MKRYVSICFVFLFCFFILQKHARADDTEAPADFVLFTEGIHGNLDALTDADRGTSVSVSGESVIEVKSTVPVSQIYLVWDKPPAVWDIVMTGEDGSESRQTFGKHGFLHEYAELSGLVYTFKLEFHGKSNALCDIHLFGEGGVPSWVQKWDPPCERADLLLFSPRSGDEFLFYGGAIPYYTSLGLEAQLAYMTNMYENPAQNHAMLDALYSTGFRNYPVISDSPERDVNADVHNAYDEDAFLAFGVEQLRRFRPQVVLAPGESDDGLTNLCYEALTVAADLSAHKLEYRDSSKIYGEYTVPKLYLHNYHENEIVMDWSGFRLGSGGKTALDAAQNAFQAYTWRTGALSGSGDSDCRKFGLYQSHVGQDIERNDLFENTSIGRTVPKNAAPAAIVSMGQPEAVPVAAFSEEVGSGPDTASPSYILMGIAGLCILAAVLLRIKREF